MTAVNGRADHDHGGGTPVLTVVVPTYNRIDRLRRLLDALGRQECTEPFEIIVVSDGSTDGTQEFLDEASRTGALRAFTQDNQGPAVARNRGIAEARGELIVFLDDDIVPEPGLLQVHLDAHRSSDGPIAVIGPMLDPPDHHMTAWVRWEQEMLQKQYDAMDRGDWEATSRQFYTGNASVRTDALRATGGFDATFKRAEDIELAFRLADGGIRFSYRRDAAGLHYAERSFEAWCTAARMYGHNDIVFVRDLRRADLAEVFVQTLRSRNLLLRVLAQTAAHTPRLAGALAGAARTLVSPHPKYRLTERTARYALSAVYCVLYYRGAAEELGSASAFRSLLRTGRID